MANIHVSISTIVKRPISETFETMTNPDMLSQWFTLIDSIRDYSGESIFVGLKYKTVGHFVGREIISDCEVLQYDVPNLLVFQSESKALLATHTWRYQALDSGTKVSINLEGKTKGFFGSLAMPLLGGQLEKDMARDLERFKQLMEK
ncbi:MAG: SRPBCC family protein [Anaerolineae bacterium]|nr:SRPBCC family protein [Anaerolineae bacterium]MDQ7037345.1 SRPBCC family protein [Anaerolineae bacterium]